MKDNFWSPNRVELNYGLFVRSVPPAPPKEFRVYICVYVARVLSPYGAVDGGVAANQDRVYLSCRTEVCAGYV